MDSKRFHSAAWFFAVCAAVVSALLELKWTSALSPDNGAMEQKRTELAEFLRKTRASIPQLRETGAESEQAFGELRALYAEHPESAPTVWFPERIKECLDPFGRAESVVRLNTVTDEDRLPGYRRAYWSIGIPVASGPFATTKLLTMIAAIEEQNRYVRLVDFALRADVEDPNQQTALLNVAAILHD